MLTCLILQGIEWAFRKLHPTKIPGMVHGGLLAPEGLRFRGSVQLRWLGLGCLGRLYTHPIPDVCSCHVLRILAVAVCKIWDVCCLPAPAHQSFSSNSLDLSAPEEAYSRTVRASGILKDGYESVFKIVSFQIILMKRSPNVHFCPRIIL